MLSNYQIAESVQSPKHDMLIPKAYFTNMFWRKVLICWANNPALKSAGRLPKPKHAMSRAECAGSALTAAHVNVV